MRTIRIAFFLSLFVQKAFSNLPEDPSAYAAWEAERLRAIEEVRNWSDEKAIPELGKWVHKLSMHHNLEKGDRPVFRTAQATLLSIPGHAEWYGEEIKKHTESAMPVPGHPNSGYDGHERMWYYATLQQLPSPETVKVLGELIFDERDPWKDGNWGDGGRPMANSLYATNTFNRLGIRNPPVHALAYNAGDQRTWQLWFEQVRSGARTFSFEGDDTVYNLAGPVRVDSGENQVKRGHQRLHSNTDGEVVSEKSSNVVLNVALTLVVLTAVFAVWRMKKRS